MAELEPFRVEGTEEHPQTVQAEDVLEAIAEGRDIDIDYAVIDGELDISQIEDRLERDKDGRLTIHGGISICRSRFSGEADFNEATFSEGANFSEATFSGKADFRGAIFSGKADFRGATFSGEADFFRATFSGEAYFYGATFSGEVDFCWATFSGEAGFVDATFSGEAIFWEATFSGKAFFVEAGFSGRADFHRASFSEGAYFGNVATERPASFAELRFRENKVLAGLWNNILHPICRPVVWTLTIGKIELPKRVVTDFSGFNTEKGMDGSSNPYLKRYINDEQWIASWRSRGWLQEAWFRVWEITSHCGRSIGLWAFWSLLIALLFGRLYATHSAWFKEAMGPLSPWYFSVVTFTTLGFGDLTPKPECWQGQAWVMFQVILGYVMLGGLISILANKLARRA